MGVAERPFYVERAGEQIPGIMWAPESPEDRTPLVLIGHGGQAEKRNPGSLAMARRFVRRHGIAACAIDAIDHGERGPIRDTGDPKGHPAYRELWKRTDTFDRMVGDWSAVLDAVVASDTVDADRVGYWGMSMGTMLGLPFVAADRRIKAAALGACGFTGPSAIRGGIGDRHRADAAKIACPVLFMVQWDDEIFARDGALEMFDAIGSADKRMHVHPGRHSDFPAEAADASREFLAAKLA
jgi:dienelactone hydrolase